MNPAKNPDGLDSLGPRTWLAKLGLRISRAAEFRFGLVPQVISLVVFAVVLVGGLISAAMVRQSQSTLREQIIANNLASADLAAEFAHRYIEGTQISIRDFVHAAFVQQSVLNDRFNAVTAVLVVSVVAEKGVAKGFPVQDYLVKPIHSEAPLTSLRSAGVLPKSATQQVMVIDDDGATLKLARIGLQAGGYRVVCHSSCASALNDAHRAEFSAVVLDLLMPQMDGFEFLARFRQIDKCRNTPVIVWTGKDVSTAEMAPLRYSAQTIALKDRDGIDTVLTELKRHLDAADRRSMHDTGRTGRELREH